MHKLAKHMMKVRLIVKTTSQGDFSQCHVRLTQQQPRLFDADALLEIGGVEANLLLDTPFQRTSTDGIVPAEVVDGLPKQA